MSTEELVTQLKNDDNVKAQKAFDQVMGSKITDALDAKKIELASGMVQRKTTEKEEE